MSSGWREVTLACVEGAAQAAQAVLGQELDPGRDLGCVLHPRASASDDQLLRRGRAHAARIFVLPSKRCSA